MKSQIVWLLVSLLLVCGLTGCGEKPKPAVEKPRPVASEPEIAEKSKPEEGEPVAAPEGLPGEIINTIGMKLKLIPAGEFMMGSPESDDYVYVDREKPQHRVRITKAFYIGTYEVTRGQYWKVTKENPHDLKGERPHWPAAPSWDDAQEFCRKLSALAEEKKAGRRYRLPTEAEWEYACRAGTTTKWYFGDDPSRLGDHGWYKGNSEFRVRRVGQKQPNPWGLYDMHGSVSEWCTDWYDDGYYANSPKDDPTGPAAAKWRVIRGGCYLSDAGECRAACREALEAEGQGSNVGFRVAADQG